MLTPALLAAVLATAPPATAPPAPAPSPVPAASAPRNLTYREAFTSTSRRVPAVVEGVLVRVPEIEGWLDDEHYLETRADADQERRLYRVRAADGKATVHRDWPALNAKAGDGFDLRRAEDATADRTRFVLEREGDLYHFDLASSRLRRLTATAAGEHNPTFSPDGRKVAYTRDGDLYAYDLEAGVERELTSDGSETILNGYASWVYFEEILGRAGAHRAFWWSPDSRRIAFMRFDDAPVPVFPIYHADGQHGVLERQRYPKAGDPNPWVQVGVVSVADAAVVWTDFEPKADHYLAFPTWTPDSKTVLVQWMNRGQDTLRLFACDAATGAKRQLHEERQAAWVEFYDDLKLLSDGRMILRSSADGWDHLYLHGPDGSLLARLTSGGWRVDGVEGVDEAGGWVYFTGRPGQPWDSHLLRVRLDGSGREVLTPEPGVHRVRVSPRGSYFTDSFSTVDRPTRLVLRRGGGELVRALGDARAPGFDSIAWGRAEVFTVPSADGAYRLPALWVLPPAMEEGRTYPVIVSVYGGPQAGSVSNSWQGLQPHYWAQRGVIHVAVDHRGSGAFGKQAAALMHRVLGRWEMEDYGAAADWLRAQPFIAGDRVAIEGGSYGGYVTMMALTAGAERFNFGEASAAVTDWRLYDSVYTERYMDTPEENPDGYRQGAVLTWIDRYRGGLRITHGTTDDNVHLQNSLQVIDALTSADRSFELMLYPDSRHGFQPSQRAHSNRETHDFWVRTLLRGEGERAPQQPPAEAGPPPGR